MRDYDELVKRLREHNGWALNETLDQAADAIEELSMKLHGDEAAIAGMKREIERMVVSGNKPRWMGTTLAGVLAGYDKVPTRRKQRARRRAGRYDWRLRIFTEETAPRQRAAIMGMR